MGTLLISMNSKLEENIVIFSHACAPKYRYFYHQTPNFILRIQQCGRKIIVSFAVHKVLQYHVIKFKVKLVKASIEAFIEPPPRQNDHA